MECQYDGCGKEGLFCIEWHGVNQYGENPEVVGEIYICSDPKHLLDSEALKNYYLVFGEPDMISDINDKDYPKLVDALNSYLESKSGKDLEIFIAKFKVERDILIPLKQRQLGLF